MIVQRIIPSSVTNVIAVLKRRQIASSRPSYTPRKLYNSVIHVTHRLGIYIVKLLLHDDRLKFILS